MADRQRVQQALKELSKAIHEALARSDAIAASAEKIREAGFQIYLVLEATVALREDGKEGEATREPETAEEPSPSTMLPDGVSSVAVPTPSEPGSASWSGHDLEFLRELRIRLG